MPGGPVSAQAPPATQRSEPCPHHPPQTRASRAGGGRSGHPQSDHHHGRECGRHHQHGRHALAHAAAAVPSDGSLPVAYPCDADGAPPASATRRWRASRVGRHLRHHHLGRCRTGRRTQLRDRQRRSWGHVGTPIAGNVFDQQVIRIDLRARHRQLPGLRLPVPLRGVPRVRDLRLQRRLRGPAQHLERLGRPGARCQRTGRLRGRGRGLDLGRRRRPERDERRRRPPARRTTARRCAWSPARRSRPGSAHSLFLTMFDQGDRDPRQRGVRRQHPLREPPARRVQVARPRPVRGHDRRRPCCRVHRRSQPAALNIPVACTCRRVRSAARSPRPPPS